MPRKPKLPPIANMVIEGLSDGREVRERSYVDELDGNKVKPIVQDMRPVRKLATGAELRIAKQHADRLAREAKASLVLQQAGWDGYRKPVELVPKGKRKIATLNGQAVLVIMPKWRRL
jgi:hypothetical protein